MSISLAWNDNFPKGYGHTSIAYLKRCPRYIEAKNGDIIAAHLVVGKCVKDNRIRKMRSQYPKALLLPVLGQNKLPLALACAIGLSICCDVYMVHLVFRKSLCAIGRLMHKPVFIGCIQRDADYILVDDVITQGGTIAALREFVINYGGNVVAVVALAYGIGSHTIAPIKKYIIQLMNKFGLPIILLLRMLGIANSIQELTNSQIRYLLRFASITNILRKIQRFDSKELSITSNHFPTLATSVLD